MSIKWKKMNNGLAMLFWLMRKQTRSGCTTMENYSVYPMPKRYLVLYASTIGFILFLLRMRGFHWCQQKEQEGTLSIRPLVIETVVICYEPFPSVVHFAWSLFLKSQQIWFASFFNWEQRIKVIFQMKKQHRLGSIKRRLRTRQIFHILIYCANLKYR